MKNKEQLINQSYENLLMLASRDKSLTSNEFRLLFFIMTYDNITSKSIQEKIGIKDKSTISRAINNLIYHKYISRNIINKVIKKGLSSYEYLVNTEKQLKD
jgi:DNA-binding MarR family transcriptional regulator